GGELKVDALVGERRDELGEQLGGDGDLALIGHLARDPAVDADLEVGGRQLQPCVLGLEQDVGEHREGGSAADGPPDDPQAARQVLLHDRYVHYDLIPTARWSSPRASPSIYEATRRILIRSRLQ